MQNLKRILEKIIRMRHFVRPYLWFWIWLFLLANISIILSLAPPYIIKLLLDDVLINGNERFLNIIMFSLVILVLLQTFIGLYLSYMREKLNQKILFKIRNELFEKIELMDIKLHNRYKIGDLLTRLQVDIGSILTFISSLFDGVISNFFLALFILAFCLYLDWKLTLVSLTAIPFFVIVQYHYGKRLREQTMIIREYSASFLDFLQERLSEIIFIKLFTREHAELEKCKKKGRGLMERILKGNLLSVFSSSLMGIIAFIPLMFILWYGGYRVIAGTLTVGSLIAIYTYIGRLFEPITSLANVNITLQTSIVGINRIFELLGLKPEIEEGNLIIKDVKGQISFRKVSFSYETKKILNNVSFDVAPGETIGIVGPVGAGKSTLINLLLRLYDPQKGDILIDGINVRKIKLNFLRCCIGVLKQRPTLFNATIRENIKYGNPEATEKEMLASARLAFVDKFVKTFPKGYDTLIGKKGVTLSAGQSQQVALARLFLKNPRIIIFDEPTSSLDPVSEKRIMLALDKIKKDRTLIIVAHRISTIRKADRILVLDRQGIAESGTFKELMKKKSLFYKFYTLQFGKYFSFLDILDKEIKRARKHGRPLSVAGIRVSGLENYEKKHGKQGAEKLLHSLYSEFSQVLEDMEIVSRDEKEKGLFYILMPEKNKKDAEKSCNNLKKYVSIHYPEFKLPLNFACIERKSAGKGIDLIRLIRKNTIKAVRTY